MNRRRFLTILGGGTVLAAVGATTWANTRTPTRALAPWRMAGSAYDEPRRKALSYALLAPNPHNRQPWQVDLSAPDVVTLHADPERTLPHTDPFDRQITIGLGCFLELMRMAAAADGYKVDVEPFPDGWSAQTLDARPIARATFRPDPDVPTDPLFAHALARRSNKEPYTDRTVEEASAAKLVAAARHGRAGAVLDPTEVARWRETCVASSLVEMNTPRTHRESVDLFRIGKAEIEANPDGIDLGGPFLEGLGTVGLLSREGTADPTSAQFEQGRDVILEPLLSAPAFVWLVTEDNERPTQLLAGADWLRMNLEATADGLGFNPHSQCLQEYPEMAEHYAEAHRRLAPKGGTVQMLARIGHGPEVPPSPRWTLDTRTTSA